MSSGNPLLEAKRAWKQQHMVTSASSGVPGHATDNVRSACLPWWPKDADTRDSTKCHTLLLYQSLLSIWLDVQIKKSTSLKVWTSIPGEKRSARWSTAPTKWNFNEQKQNLISLLRKQVALFFSCFRISLAQHLPFYSGTSSLRTEKRLSVSLHCFLT